MDSLPKSPQSTAQLDDSDPDATVVTPASSVTPEQYPSGITVRELSHVLQGEMLGHFLLQEFIGGGGMGVVFKAYDTRLDRIVAVKVVASQRISSEDLQRRFMVEAQSAARLDHPNIARVYDVDRARGLSYIVFEYVEGRNLRETIAQRGPLPLVEALHYTYQLAHALAHAAERDVVHRDIKPSNILVTEEGQTKLVDMGLARLKQADTEEADLTANGVTLGTFDYISPEQARDPRSADARSDIYSLGCTLFYMLAGEAPFAKGSMVEKLMQHQAEHPPELRQYRSDVPDSVNVLLRTMLAKSPADRQQHPAVLAGQLRHILQELGSPVSQLLNPVAPYVLPQRHSAWRNHLPWAIPALLLLAATPFIDGWLARDHTSTEFVPVRVSPEIQTAPLVSGKGSKESSNPAKEASRDQTVQAQALAPSTSPAKAPPAKGPPSKVPTADATAKKPSSESPGSASPTDSPKPPLPALDPELADFSFSVVPEESAAEGASAVSPIENFAPLTETSSISGE